jgi:hypothetical protein
MGRSSKGGFLIHIQALQRIEQGEELTIRYVVVPNDIKVRRLQLRHVLNDADCYCRACISNEVVTKTAAKAFPTIPFCSWCGKVVPSFLKSIFHHFHHNEEEEKEEAESGSTWFCSQACRKQNERLERNCCSKTRSSSSSCSSSSASSPSSKQQQHPPQKLKPQPPPAIPHIQNQLDGQLFSLELERDFFPFFQTQIMPFLEQFDSPSNL